MINITVSGGIPPYMFTVVNNGLYYLDTTNAYLQLPNTIAETFEILVTDNAGNETTLLVPSCAIQNCSVMITDENGNESTAICPDGSTTLTASGEGQFLWSTGAIGTSSITVSESDTYTVTLTESNGCKTEDSHTVILRSLLPIQMNNDTTICSGNNVSLSATRGIDTDTFQWSTGATSSIITVTPDQTTDYTVTVTTVAGCIATDSVTIEVMIPTVNAGNDQSICEGESTTLTAEGNGTFSWNTNQGGASIIVTPTETTTYIVTAIVSSGCTATDSVTVEVYESVGVNAGGDQTICIGDSTILVANGDEPFTWSTGEIGQFITVSPNETTTYTVTVGNEYGCTDIDDIRVNVQDLPIVDLGDTQTICEGDSTTLKATGSGSFQWSDGQSGRSITVKPIKTTYYTVTVTNSVCELIDSVLVEIQTFPATPEIILKNPENQPFSLDNPGVLICTLDSTIAKTYQWKKNGSPLIGATHPFLFVTEPADYAVALTYQAEYENNCAIEEVGYQGKQLEFVNATKPSIQVYPNPTNKELYLNIHNPEQLPIQWKIFSILGQCIFEENVPPTTQHLQTSFSFQDFAKGIYWVQIEVGTEKYMEAVVFY